MDYSRTLSKQRPWRIIILILCIPMLFIFYRMVVTRLVTLENVGVSNKEEIVVLPSSTSTQHYHTAVQRIPNHSKPVGIVDNITISNNTRNNITITPNKHQAELESSTTKQSTQSTTTTTPTLPNNNNNPTILPILKSSIAIIIAGDARTLLCPAACASFHQAIIDPLVNAKANYSVHIFAYIKPTVYYGIHSPWTMKSPQCANADNGDTPFLNVSKSFVSNALVEDAIGCLVSTASNNNNNSTNSRNVNVKTTLHVVDDKTVASSWDLTVQQRAEHVGCSDMLHTMGGPNVNTTKLILGGYVRYSQWKAVHDGYVMMEEAELESKERFEYAMRLRPDTYPLMESILDSEGRLPVSPPSHSNGGDDDDDNTDNHERDAIVVFGDGHAIMPRGKSSNAYFNVYQTYANYCETHLRYNQNQYVWGENSDGYYAKYVTEEKGVPIVQKHENFTFWFRRPRTCTRLCEDNLLASDH